MDYTSTPGFDNPFASEDFSSPLKTSSAIPTTPGFGGNDGFRSEDIQQHTSGGAAGGSHPHVTGGLFGGEDNSPAGGLFGEGHDEVERGGFGGVGGAPTSISQVRQQVDEEEDDDDDSDTPRRNTALPQPLPQKQTSQAQQQQQYREQPQQVVTQQYRGEPQGGQRRQAQGTGSGGDGRGQNQRQVQQYRLQAKVTALERLGRKDPVIRFDVHTNLPRFRTTQFRDVRRTHPEFTKLAEHLLSNNPECFVPAVPPPSTSAGVGTEEDDARVRGTMQRWLNYVCGNDVLMRDEEMILFVESDSGYSPVVRKKQPATGVRRRVLKQFAPPPDETPELADARPIVKAFYLGTMETGQKVDKVVKARRGLGLAESDLGIKFYSLSACEAHPGMGNALRKLGKTIQQVGDYHAAQATSEATTLGDPLQYHSSDAFIVKETLTNRQIIQRELQQAQANTKSKESTAARIRAGSNIKKDKSDEVIAQAEEARHVEEQLTQKFTRVTANLVQERRRWFHRTSMDLRSSIRDYVLRQIEAERRLLSTLESVRPDIRAIDSSGGLSRLGRDAPPASRRASVAASQGPRGDAWSGVPRAGGAIRSSVGGAPPLDGVSSPVNGGGAGAGGLGEGGEGHVGGHQRSRSGGSKSGGGGVGGLAGIEEGGVGEDDHEEDRLDAKNAASRLATSTF